MALEDSPVERRDAVLVGRVNLRPAVQEQRRQLLLPSDGGPVQRRNAGPVAGAGVRPLPDQEPGHVSVLFEDGPVERRHAQRRVGRLDVGPAAQVKLHIIEVASLGGVHQSRMLGLLRTPPASEGSDHGCQERQPLGSQDTQHLTRLPCV